MRVTKLVLGVDIYQNLKGILHYKTLQKVIPKIYR